MMKLCTFVFGIVAVSGTVHYQSNKFDPKAAHSWKQWKSAFNKKYNTELEEITRFEIWSKNMKTVEEHNAAFAVGLTSFDLEMNKFADLTIEEFSAQVMGSRPIKEDASVGVKSTLTKTNLPESVNWTAQGYVTPVKDQGQCASCWAFSTTGSLEGQHYNATGELLNLSEQQLIDCDSYCYGCGGGWVNYGFLYIIQRYGSVLESDYPYTASDGTCVPSGLPIAATMSSYTHLPRRDEGALKAATALIGPISVTVDASYQSFQLYKSGVYYEPLCNAGMANHAVLVVGYGTDSVSGMDYWLVKNSWGETWGELGYIRMARNKDNNCGIASNALYPII